MSDDSMLEKAKGTAKEVAGKATGSDEMAKEGQAQQKKGMKEEEAQEAQAEANAKAQQAAGYEGEQRKHQ
jgi:uncharacterized protein YjbJ (UPF0337 family)